MSVPLPIFDIIIDKLGQVKPTCLTVTDMKSCFWQIELDEESKEKSTFGGNFQFKRMPFGLVNSPATNQ